MRRNKFWPAALCTTLFFLPLTTEVNSQNSSPPAVPGCTCSRGVEINYPGAPADNKVYAANCICGPQYCATTWNKTIALQCTQGAANIGLKPNCADFTKMRVGKYGQSMTAGLFSIVSSPPATPGTANDLEVRFDEVGSNPTPTPTPNGLHSGAEFNYPQLYRKAVIDLATYMGGGNFVSIVTGKNSVQSYPYAADPIHGKTIRLTIENQDGIKSLRFPQTEVLVFEVCAVDPI